MCWFIWRAFFREINSPSEWQKFQRGYDSVQCVELCDMWQGEKRRAIIVRGRKRL